MGIHVTYINMHRQMLHVSQEQYPRNIVGFIYLFIYSFMWSLCLCMQQGYKLPRKVAA